MQNMQRVRIGLTGLAFVFILVLLGAIFSRGSDERPITPGMIEDQMIPANEGDAAQAESEPKEPLAELGVAPGNADSNASGNEQTSPAR